MSTKEYNINRWKNLKVQAVKDLTWLLQDVGGSVAVGKYKLIYREEHQNPMEYYPGYLIYNPKDGKEFGHFGENIERAIKHLVELVTQEDDNLPF